MTPWLAALIGMSIVCDVSGQFCFKRGADGLDWSVRGFSIGAFASSIVAAPWLWLGVLIYVVEFVVWLTILSRVPLSLAYPLNSLNYVGVVLASRLFLSERVTVRRWLGAGLITLGVAIVGAAA